LKEYVARSAVNADVDPTIAYPSSPPFNQSEACPQKVANASTATDISSIGEMTRSGRCYSPEYLERLRKGKAREGEEVPPAVERIPLMRIEQKSLSLLKTLRTREQ
jgi:hypothetical protein